MERIVKKAKSVRVKLFLILCLVVLSIIAFLILVNSFVLEKYYQYTKSNNLKSTYALINSYYTGQISVDNISDELDKISISNNFDIIIKDNENVAIYMSNKDFLSSIRKVINFWGMDKKQEATIIEQEDNIEIKRIVDTETKMTYMLLKGTLDNGFVAYIRLPMSSITESVQISNKFLYLIACIVIIVGGIVIIYISKQFSSPISEISAIAKKMANLDFSQKYVVKDDDEINELGKNINIMSEKLEGTINQLRSTNIELERDIERKSKIDEMRKSFISDVSHELKTPITSIMGYADTLLETDHDKAIETKFLGVISSEAKRMSKLVTDLLSLSRFDSNKTNIVKEEFDLGELAKKCQEKLQIEIDKKNLQVHCLVTANVPPVYAEKDGIERVIINILSNSIKYTNENGTINIYVGFVYNDAYIKFIDTGIGIPEEDLERIFERFYRVDKARTREMGGTGLGLSIAKEILDRNNGTIDIKSKLNEGTEVVIRIPTKTNNKFILKEEENLNEGEARRQPNIQEQKDS